MAKHRKSSRKKGNLVRTHVQVRKGKMVSIGSFKRGSQRKPKKLGV